MELVQSLVDFILHIDVHLAEIARWAGAWTYGVVALIVFCETGLVVTPFLPGDSLLFATGALTALPGAGLNVHLMAAILLAAAILGDAANYTIGKYFGERVAARFIKPKYLEQTRAFYERHGGKTIVLARFVPIVRTLAPFVAGMGQMEYRRFFVYNVTGALAWVGIFLYAGYFFGNLPWVKERFSLVIFAVIGLSLLPMVFELARHRLGRKEPAGAVGSAVTEAREAAAEVAAGEAEREVAESREEAREAAAAVERAEALATRAKRR